jgi:hypothetical protein
MSILCVFLDVSSVDDIRIRFQGGVELILAPPAAIPGLVFPELMTPSGSNSNPAELMTVLRDVAAAGAQMKSSLSPLRPLPTLPAPKPVTPSVKPEMKIEYVTRDVEEGRGSPPSKRFCKCVCGSRWWLIFYFL